MKQLVEVAYRCLAKHGEELCGDAVRLKATPSSLIVGLSDGLGSGVKAHILATLTVTIGVDMLEKGETIDEVIETLTDTLPECQVRRLAYATFSVLMVEQGRRAYLVEYDNPPLVLIRDRQLVSLPMVEREVGGRSIRECKFELQEGDYMTLVSDGYVHAGVGGLYKLGWGWKNLAVSLTRWAATGGDAYQLTGALARTCLKLYDGRPGDDATAVGMKVRRPVLATILTGPPSRPELDRQTVERFMAAEGLKVICGGTTAQVAARETGHTLRVLLERRLPGVAARKEKIPPMARLEGVDLVTEGIITLSKASERLQVAETIHDLPPAHDGATELARVLLRADVLHFMVGEAINPYQLADVVRGKPMRQVYVEELIAQLETRGKVVTVERL
ncbi:MAG TPA: SpoIIE family protein phosphatase [Anaerolineae bacterium]|nr:SpoIIE family protein phosphatase [Anaerolineae bacterium]HOR01429.1 SpoIIE family protein phosphatase [Anaerolineae bacterium]HPL28481.1 SpoIIE family protein phosphatase [Anaerolineae bacterium]